MFVGHAVLAFAIAVALTRRRLPERQVLALGLVAALFATVPDADMVYALVGLGGAVGDGGPMALANGFWSASTVTHRGATHSLLVAVPAAFAFAVRGRIGLAIVGGLYAVTLALSGPLAAAVVLTFGIAGLLVGHFGAGALTPRWLFGAALLGLLTHPFGDLLTGGPPALLWPLDVVVFTERVELFVDPTLNLLLAFFVELAVLWLGVLALASLRGVRLRRQFRPTAALGAAYAAVAFVLPPPTMDASYSFVFSVLAVGFVGAVPTSRRRHGLATALVTGLAAVTVAGLAYTVVHLAA